MKKHLKTKEDNINTMKRKGVVSVILIASLIFAMGFVLAEDIGTDPAGEIPESTNCGGTQDPDAYCVNLGYDSWDTEAEECILEPEPVDPEQPVEKDYCENSGGTWTTFNNGCADTCEYVRSPETISCIQALTESCDCGPDKCWNGESCEDNNLEDVQEDIPDEPIIIGGCAGVAPENQDACCINLGYESWDSELEKCVSEQNYPKVCCKIYGYGAMMAEVNVHYQLMKKEDCAVPENFVGGNREIVNLSYCRLRAAPKEEPPRDMNQERKAIQIQKVIQARNRLEYRIHQANGTCPENCTCDGSAMKCWAEDGSREMIIRAGNSGNTIVQVKNSEMQTNVALFKADDGGVFGVFRNNQTKRIILPDEASETAKQKIQERIKQEQRERKQIRLEQENITLTEEGYYDIQAKKHARLFWIIPVKERVQTQVDAETGSVVKVRNPWWGFLARDVRVEAEDVPLEEME
jgi:hypothetical protein